MAYTVCHVPLKLLVRRHHTFVTIATMELQTGMLRTLAVRHPYDVNPYEINVTS